MKSIFSVKLGEIITEEGSKSNESNDSVIGTMVSLISSDMSMSIEVAEIITVGTRVERLSKSAVSSSSYRKKRMVKCYRCGIDVIIFRLTHCKT